MNKKITRRIYLMATGLIALLGVFIYTQVHPASAATEYTNPYEWAGQAHNDGVLYVLESIDTLPDTVEEFDAYAQEMIEEFWATQDYPETPRIAHSSMLDDLYNTLDAYDGRSLDQLHQKVWEMEQIAATELEGNELATFQISASIGRHSATLWTPVENGGLGASTTVVEDEVFMAFIDLGDIIQADTIGYLKGGLREAVKASLDELVDQIFDWWEGGDEPVS